MNIHWSGNTTSGMANSVYVLTEVTDLFEPKPWSFPQPNQVDLMLKPTKMELFTNINHMFSIHY